MATYTEIKAGLDEIAVRNRKNLNDMDRAKSQLVSAEANLDAMPAAYTVFINAIDVAATANPEIQAFQLAKSEKDQLVIDFQTLQIRASALVLAVDGI